MTNFKKYKKNEVIFSEGETGDTMYDIVWGSVGIYSAYKTPDQKLLKKLTEDEMFGEMGMIEARPRSATAVALEETQVYEITLDRFGDYISQKPAKAITILQNTSKRLRELSCDYVDACAAISEYVAAEEAGETPDDLLLKRMKKITDARKKKK